jgi:hypothetical protein
MIISKLIEELERVKAREGDIEVTCTACTYPDGYDFTEKRLRVPQDGLSDVYETTCDTLIVKQPNDVFDKKRVRLYL